MQIYAEQSSWVTQELAATGWDEDEQDVRENAALTQGRKSEEEKA